MESIIIQNPKGNNPRARFDPTRTATADENCKSVFPSSYAASPPLLPLPTFRGCSSNRTRGFSCPPTGNRKASSSKKRDQSLTPKKPKHNRKNPNREYPVAAEPGKGSSLSSSCVEEKDDTRGEVEVFSGSVSMVAPPPSSLPLPKFFIRPPLRCNAEASGVDVGATDDLRRLLRLQ